MTAVQAPLDMPIAVVRSKMKTQEEFDASFFVFSWEPSYVVD
jgi:hypothetical protein